MIWEFPLEAEITVQFPTGIARDGVIAARKKVGPEHEWNRYTILYDDDTADTMIPPTWIHPRRQRTLPEVA